MNYSLINLQKVRAIVNTLSMYAEAVDSLETNINMSSTLELSLIQAG